jgi:CRISPR system Cascade subunit CasC
LADAPDFNTEAACQVAHAITVHKVAIEDDFFTAVDDLNKRGSAHLGEQGFAAGLFYLYACIDCSSLSERLGDELAKRTISALTQTAATVAPSGKQNSFGSRAWASYILAEKGPRQPRSLSVAFLAPIKGENMLVDAIEKLEKTRRNMDGVYHGWNDSDKKDSDGEKLKIARSLPSYIIDTTKGQGDFQALLNFVGMNGGA